MGFPLEECVAVGKLPEICYIWNFVEDKIIAIFGCVFVVVLIWIWACGMIVEMFTDPQRKQHLNSQIPFVCEHCKHSQMCSRCGTNASESNCKRCLGSNNAGWMEQPRVPYSHYNTKRAYSIRQMEQGQIPFPRHRKRRGDAVSEDSQDSDENPSVHSD